MAPKRRRGKRESGSSSSSTRRGGSGDSPGGSKASTRSAGGTSGRNRSSTSKSRNEDENDNENHNENVRERRGESEKVMGGSASLLASLIDKLSSLSSSKSRCSSMIQSISQGRHLLTFITSDYNHHHHPKEDEQQSKQSNDKSDTDLLSDTRTNDANLVIIATHIINRLILHLRSSTTTTKHDDNCDDKNTNENPHENTNTNIITNANANKEENEEEGFAIILAALSYKLSQILLLDKAALERVISPTFGSSSKSISIHRTANANANNLNDAAAPGTDARSILSRALLSVVMGCITSCHTLTTQRQLSIIITTSDTNKSRLALIRKALWSSLLGLETVVNFTSPPTPDTNPTTADICTSMANTHTNANANATANTNAATNLSSSNNSKSSSTSIKFNATTHAHVHSVPMNHALSQTWKDLVRCMSVASNMDVSLSDDLATESDDGTTTTTTTTNTDYSHATIGTLDHGQGSQDGAKDYKKANRRGKKGKHTLGKDVSDESLSMKPNTTSTATATASGPMEKDIQNELASICTFICSTLFSSATQEEEQTLLLEIVSSCVSSNIKTFSSPLINESDDKAKEQSHASNTTATTNTTTTLSPPTKRPKRSSKRSTKSNTSTSSTTTTSSNTHKSDSTSNSNSGDDSGESSSRIPYKSLEQASNILFNTPEYTFNTIAIDGGFVSVKKWASMVLVWLCKGQDILLDVSLSLLDCDDHGNDSDGGSAHSGEYGVKFWSRIMEPPILSETITSSPSSSGHPNIPASLSTATTSSTTEPSTSSSSEKRKKRGRGSKRSFRTMAEDGITDSHDSTTGNAKNDAFSGTLENVNPTLSTTDTSAAIATASTSTLASTTSTVTDTSPSSTSSSSAQQHPFIPGNVTLVTYVTRLINLMVESCGTTAPKGGMDVYAGLVLKPTGFEYRTGRHYRTVDPVKEEGKGEGDDGNNNADIDVYGTIHAAAANDDQSNAAESVAASLSWQLQQRTTRNQSGRKSRSDKTRGIGVGNTRSSSSSSRVSLPLSLGTKHAANMNTSTSLPGTEYKWKRPDIRSKAAVLMRLLLIAHERCLKENIALPVLSIPEKGGVGSNEETKGEKRESLKGLDLVESMHLSKSSPLLYPLDDSDGTVVQVLLNEDYDSNCAQQNTELERMKYFTPKFFPTMHKTIESLARIASSSVLEPAHVDVFDSMSLLLDVGSALAFKYSLIVQKRKNIRDEGICNTSVDTVVIVDTKLCSMGAHHLSDRVGNIVSSSKYSFLDVEERPNVSAGTDIESERDGPISDELVEKFCLNKPLLPVLPKEDDEDSSSSGFCDYGGIFNFSPSRLGSDVDMVDASYDANDKSRQQRHLKEQNRISNGEVLSLFLRAMLPENGKELSNEKKNDTASLLVKNLLRIIGCCYAVSDNLDMVENDSIRTTYTRCILSADCLDLLGKCLCYFPWGSRSSSDPAVLLSTRLRCALRKASLSPSYFCYFIELGNILERNLVGHRLRLAENYQESVKVETKASLLIGSSFGNRFEFDHWERRLWSSHVKLCLTLGRGNPTFNSRFVCHLTFLETSFLGCVVDRLSIFEAVTNITMSRPNLENSDHLIKRWPLYLSSIHHALVTSNLMSDPLPQNSEDAAPERFICDAFISSIDDALQNPMSIVNQEPLSMENKRNARRFQYSDDEIPLSLRDARLFAILVFRLQREDRTKILSNLVNVLCSNLSNTKQNRELTEIFIKYKDASGFLARVITVCLTMAEIACAGNELFDLLCQQIGPTHYHLPSFIEPSIYGDSTEENECDWYKKETCFMGLFSDWESPTTPAVGLIESDEPLSVTDLSKLKTALEISLNLGFESAKVDRCHLLFAAWNASGKVSCWDKSPRAGTFTTKKFCECGDALKMIKLRDDMCYTYTKVGKDVNSVPESFLSKILKKKSSFRETELTHSGAGLLKQGLTESIAYLKDFDEKSSSEITSETISSVFVSYEATVSYISFLISMFTKSDNEFLSTFVKPDKARNGRKRKDSSLSADSLEDGLEDEISDESGESESGYPDFEDDDEEAKLDGISRLHDVCNVIGAAPFHPDWLDIHCRYRSGVSEEIALDSAEKAFASLTHFGNKIYSKYKNCIQRAFYSYRKLESDPQQLGFDRSLPFLIMSTLQQSEESNGRDEENETGWKKAVANIFSVDENVIHLITGKLHCRNKCSVKEAFCPNSAQRIRGKLQEFSSSIDGWEASTSEHRAGSEWELLLSDAFLGTCTDIKFPSTWKSSTSSVPSDSRCTLDDASDVKNIFTEAYRWCRVLHATVSAMVTCTALIRFSLNHGKGRKPHPLSKRDSNIQNRQLLHQISSSACSLDEEVYSPLNNSHHNVKNTLSKALAFLSEIASCGVVGKDLRQCAQAAACHLLRNNNDFNNLVAMNAIKNSLLCIKGLSEITSTDRNDAIFTGKNTVLEKMVILVEKLSHLDSSNLFPSNTGGFKLKCTRLLSCLGFRCILPLSTIAEESLDSRLLLAMNVFNNDTNSNESALAWDWSETQTETLNLLISMSQGVIQVNLKARSILVLLMKNLLESEEYFSSNEPDITRESAFIKSSMKKNWNKVNEDHLQLLTRNDICVNDVSFDSNSLVKDRTFRIELSRNQCFILAYLVGSISFSPPLKSPESQACKVILRNIKECIEDVLEKPELIHVMDLACLLATRFDELIDIGMQLMYPRANAKVSESIIQNSHRLAILEHFCRFLRDVRAELDGHRRNKMNSSTNLTETKSSNPSKNNNSSNKNTSDAFQTKSSDPKLRACTFVETGGEYSEQHWYNCYTCGLVWEKGCCSLCAQICHKGHDVGYSRSSSFFCDCGAEVACAGEQNRVACKCLSPLSNTHLLSYENNQDPCASVSSGTKEFDDAKVISQDYQENKDSIFNNKVVEISVRCFPSCTSLALDHFVEEAAKSVFTKKLFEKFNASFDKYRSEKKNRKSLYGLNSGDQEVEKSKLEKDQSRLQDLSLNFRSGKPVEIKHLKDVAFIPIRASKGNSLKPKLSFDATTERLKRAVLSKNDIKRNILVSDHRGRLIIAESSSILFCAGLPLVNIRHAEKPLELPLERSQLCILGLAKVKFCIVGMELCSDDNRQLLVWGTSEASVFFLSKDCDKVEKRIDLVVELEPHECETEYLLKAEWMPSSSGMIIVIFCATFVKIFDIRRSTANSGGRDQEYSCRASTCYTLAYEDVIIRGAALIRPKVNTAYEDINSESGQNDAKEAICSKMVLLFDSGRLHMTDISLDSNGDLEDQGESYIECGDGISFPTSGVRRYNGGSAGAPGSKSTSFGEGSSLIYLSQSGLLLYKCISSSLIAFNLDENGNIIGSFEFLPHVINTETLAMGMEGHSISDPYTQWKELGTVEREGSFFYRVAFVGKSTRNNQPKLLYLEFNSNEINVNELSWPAGNGMSLEMSLNTSFEGVAAFSGPLFHEKRTQNGFIGNQMQIMERVFLGVVTSNGSLLMFGESTSETSGLKDALSFHNDQAFTSSKRGRDLSDSTTAITNEQSKRSERSNLAKTSDSNCTDPIFPLTIFERLINVSNKIELRFGGDGTGNEPELVKKKLSISSVDFVTSPSKDGCTFTVTLRSNKQNDLNKTESLKKDGKLICKTTNIDKANENFSSPAKFAIVAIRILVGSTRIEYLPREFVVMGRPIKLKQGMKRWYDIPLTDEEILLGVRSGFVTIGIGASFDLSNNQGPLIDAVEVYAQEREKMPHIFSFGVDDAGTTAECSNDQQKKSSTNILSEEEISKQSLNSSMLAVTHICQLLGKNIDQSSHLNHQTLQRLIQVTALDSHGQGEVRSHVIELLKEVENDVVTRQMLLDEGTLLGVAEVLRDELEKRFGMPPHTGTSDSTNNTFEKHLFAEKQPGPIVLSNSQNEEVLCNLNRCIKSSLSIVKSRPENYKQIMENLRSSGLITSSVANDAKVVLDCFDFTVKNFSDTAANMIELAILEMVTEETSAQKDPKFVGMGPILSDMLNSRNSVLVQHCCFTIAKVLGDTAIKSNMRMETENNGVNIPPPIAYQCDGCETFPITGTRYTLEEGHDIDLCKTCYESGCNFAKSKNYESGIALEVNGKRLRLDDKEMTCDQVHQMRPMPIASIIVEQVRRAAESAPNSSVIEDADEDTAALQHALKMSLETQGESHFPANDFAESIPPILYVVRSRLFDGLLEVVCQSLSFGANDSGVCHLPSIIDLLLTLVFKSEPGKDQIDLGKKLCETICKQMVMLIDLCIRSTLSKESSKKVRSSLFLCLRALVSLLKKKDLSFTDIVENSEAEESNEPDTESSMLLGEKNKDKTDPRFICDVHSVPAVRRRCSHGEHKDRRFYVCGMERKQRCKYFKWADAEDAPKNDSTSFMSSLDQTKTNQQFDSSVVSSSKGNSKEPQKVSVDSEIQSQLWSLISEGVPSLQMQLCKLLQVYFKKMNSNSSTNCGIACTSNEEKILNEKSSIVFPMYNETCALEDLHDGISNSIEKLGFSCHPCIKGLGSPYLNAKDTAVQGSNESSVVQASLDLLSLIAMNSLGPSTKSSPSTWECWFAPLCEIISTSSSSHLRAQAKKMLKRLCGGRRAIYHKVRDHYVFGFHFTQLLQHCEGLLRAALAVREKARRCGSDWRSAKITWRTLPSGGLIGVEDLISEDSQTVETCDKVRKVLDELIDITKTRGQNWRHFCALNGLPKNSNIIKAGSTGSISSKVSIERKNSVLELNARGGIRDRSPICLLLWIACSVSGSNQVKVFQLMDVALSSSPEQCASPKALGADENIGILSTDGGTDFEGSIQNHPQGIINSDADCPGISLLSGLTGIAVDDIFAFIVQFVLKGKTPALRIVTSSIARSLVLASPCDEMDNLFQRLTLLMLRHIGELGCEAADFLKLMHSFVSEKQILKAIALAPISNVVMSCFTNQISTCHNAKSSLLGEEAKVIEIEIGQGKKKTFDLTSCARCQLRGLMSCEDTKKATEKDKPTSSQGSLNTIGKASVGSNRTLRSGSTVTSLSGKKNDFTDVPWAVEQVRGFSRNRIEVSTLNIISTEFASHFQLKSRLAISEFHLSVNDPRGRFVKSIGIFFTPRPVSAANELSRDEYKDIWQRCGTLTLTRGAGRASCKLSNPIVAANLKFEYLEFFEKIGGARSSDGSLLLHCPRCTRVVNNAHGVCGHCGEVAFQCRKCRHINYDRLDAFLCVECGYCASGGFSYEISAGMASRAVAIVNDDGLERAIKLLRISSRKLSDTKIALRKKLLEAAVCTQRKRHRGDNFDDLDGINSYSPPLKRALLGEFPKVSGKGMGDYLGGGDAPGKRRSTNSGAHSSNRQHDSSSLSSPTNKARSLLSLARQLRSESSGLGDDHTNRGDLLVRQALMNSTSGIGGGNSGGSFEFFDETEGDMLGIINASGEGNVLHLDMPEPLSRLVANIQARVRNSATGTSAGRSEAGADGRRGGSAGNNEDGGNIDTESQKNDQSPQSHLDDCEKLQQQLREAERDCSDLQRKIMSWKRLNRDALTDFGEPILTAQLSYAPITCSTCSQVVTFHLLALAMALFQANIEDSEKGLSKEFIWCLFEEPKGMTPDFFDVKRLAIITIATKSKIGAKLIFDELRSRLDSTRDVASAEILGKLLEKEFSMVNEYTQLAVDILRSNE